MIVPGRLTEIAETIEAPRGAIESAFFEVGDELSHCSADLSDLMQRFEGLVAEFQGPDVQAASGTLDAVAEAATGMADAFAAEGPVVAGLVRKVAKVAKPVSDLNVSIRMIGMVALNARIVAAGLAGEVSVFRTDIAVLSNEAGEIVKNFSGLFDRLAADLRQVDEQRRQFSARHERTLHELSAQLRARLAHLSARRGEAGTVSRQTAEISRGITSRVATAVVALQVGDSARQRIEHVQAALRDGEAFRPGDPQEAALFRGMIAALQGAQLRDTAQTFDAELAGARNAVRTLKTDAAAIIRQSRALQRFGTGRTAEGGGDLGQELRQIAALLTQCEGQRRSQTAYAMEVVKVVRALTSQAAEVALIEEQLRSLCLNPTVACGRLGAPGRPLAVIADQIHDLTADTGRSVRIVLDELGEISDQARQLSMEEDEVEDKTGHKPGAGPAPRGDAESGLGTAALSAVDLLDGVAGRLAEAATAMERLVPHTAERFDSAAARLDRLATVSGDLRREASRLDALAGPVPSTLDDESAGFFGVLRGRYTMQREREIHDAMFGTTGAATGEAANDSGFEDPEDDLDAMFL